MTGVAPPIQDDAVMSDVKRMLAAQGMDPATLGQEKEGSLAPGSQGPEPPPDTAPPKSGPVIPGGGDSLCKRLDVLFTPSQLLPAREEKDSRGSARTQNESKVLLKVRPWSPAASEKEGEANGPTTGALPPFQELRFVLGWPGGVPPCWHEVATGMVLDERCVYEIKKGDAVGDLEERGVFKLLPEEIKAMASVLGGDIGTGEGQTRESREELAQFEVELVEIIDKRSYFPPTRGRKGGGGGKIPTAAEEALRDPFGIGGAKLWVETGPTVTSWDRPDPMSHCVFHYEVRAVPASVPHGRNPAPTAEAWNKGTTGGTTTTSLLFDTRAQGNGEQSPCVLEMDEVGGGGLFATLRIACSQLRRGEKATVVLPVDDVLVTAGSSLTPPSSATKPLPANVEALRVELDTMSFDGPKAAFKLEEPEERAKAAESLKAKANDLLKAGEMERAVTRYKRALEYVEFSQNEERRLDETAEKADTAEKEEMEAEKAKQEKETLRQKEKALALSLLLNLALGCLKLGPGWADEALTWSERALVLDPGNTKAAFRKAKALIELGDLKRARYELGQMIKLDPKDPEPRKELDRVKKMIEENKESEKKQFTGMFDKLQGFAGKGRKEEVPLVPGSAAYEPYKFQKEDLKANPFAKEASQAAKLETAYSLDVLGFARKLAYQEGKSEDAIWAFEATIRAREEDDPISHAAWLELGKLYADMNQDMPALRCLRDPASCPKFEAPVGVQSEALLLLGVCSLNEGEEKAVSWLSRWADYRLGSPAVPFALDKREDPEGEWNKEEPEELAERVACLAGPGDPDALIALGLLRLLTGETQECIRAFAAAIASEEPPRVDSEKQADKTPYFSRRRRMASRWNMLGAVLSSTAETEKALLAYGCALSLQPRFPRVLANRATALAELKRGKEGCRDSLAALQMLPSWAQDPFWVTMMVASTAWADDEVIDAVKAKDLVVLQKKLGNEEAPEMSAIKAASCDPAAVADEEGPLPVACGDPRSLLREMGLLEVAEEVLSGAKPLVVSS